jgi:SAM-dependent methyltransferase
MEHQKINTPAILDACCGGRMMWFNKHHPAALYIDNRNLDAGFLAEYPDHAKFCIEPDKIMDFRHLNIPAESFYLVVFDPPHLMRNTGESYMAKKYGRLDKSTWHDDLRRGFAECWRVLKPCGTLIFKWSEHDIKVSEIIKVIGHQPLFGHKSGKNQKTHWLCFFKTAERR